MSYQLSNNVADASSRPKSVVLVFSVLSSPFRSASNTIVFELSEKKISCLISCVNWLMSSLTGREIGFLNVRFPFSSKPYSMKSEEASCVCDFLSTPLINNSENVALIMILLQFDWSWYFCKQAVFSLEAVVNLQGWYLSYVLLVAKATNFCFSFTAETVRA